MVWFGQILLFLYFYHPIYMILGCNLVRNIIQIFDILPSTALLCCMLRHIQTIIDSSLKTSIVHSKYILGTVKYTQRRSTMCLRRFTTNNNEYMHQRFMSLTRSINISQNYFRTIGCCPQPCDPEATNSFQIQQNQAPLVPTKDGCGPRKPNKFMF